MLFLSNNWRIYLEFFGVFVEESCNGLKISGLCYFGLGNSPVFVFALSVSAMPR